MQSLKSIKYYQVNKNYGVMVLNKTFQNSTHMLSCWSEFLLTQKRQQSQTKQAKRNEARSEES